MATGTLCAVKTSRASARLADGTCLECVHGAGHHGLDEERMVGPRRRVHHLGGARADLAARGGHIGHVALPRGLDLERGEDDSERATVAARPHFRERLAEKRVPVPQPHVHRRGHATPSQRPAQPVRLSQGQLVQRRSAADQLVVVRHLVDAVGRNAAARGHDL